MSAPVHTWNVPGWLEPWFRYTVGELPTGDEYALWRAGQGLIDEGRALQGLADELWSAANRAAEGMWGSEAAELLLGEAQWLRDELAGQAQAARVLGEFVFDYAAKVQQVRLTF